MSNDFPFCFQALKHDIWSKDVLIELKNYGINKISIEPNAYMSDKFTRDDIYRLREMLDEAGLSVMTSHPPFGSFNKRFSTLRQSPSGLKELGCLLQTEGSMPIRSLFQQQS